VCKSRRGGCCRAPAGDFGHVSCQERGKTERGARGTGPSPNLGQGRRGDGRPWTAVELPLVTLGMAGAGERGKMERGARGTDSSPHLGQGRRGEGDRRRVERRDLRQLYRRQARWRQWGCEVRGRRRGGEGGRWRGGEAGWTTVQGWGLRW
jgi:hypothetical protein